MVASGESNSKVAMPLLSFLITRRLNMLSRAWTAETGKANVLLYSQVLVANARDHETVAIVTEVTETEEIVTEETETEVTVTEATATEATVILVTLETIAEDLTTTTLTTDENTTTADPTQTTSASLVAKKATMLVTVKLQADQGKHTLIYTFVDLVTSDVRTSNALAVEAKDTNSGSAKIGDLTLTDEDTDLETDLTLATTNEENALGLTTSPEKDPERGHTPLGSRLTTHLIRI
jgi:hypothetical protein